MSKGLSIYQKAVLQRVRERGSINILEVCNLVFEVQATKKDPSFKPIILSRIYALEEIDNNTQGIYRMMRSLEKRGLVARLLHRRPTVWFNISWQDEKLKLEPGSYGWYHFNRVMYRDGQVLFRTKGLQWIIKGVKIEQRPTKTTNQTANIGCRKDKAGDAR